MSARTNGSALWLVRPIIDGVAHDDMGVPFVGNQAEMVEHISRLHRETGQQHAAVEVEQ